MEKVKNLIGILLLTYISTSLVEAAIKECRTTVKARDYAGTQSRTADGIECQAWDIDNDPHSIVLWDNYKFPENSRSGASNYCRNPDNKDGGPWCYTKNPEERWQYCNVPFCNGVVDNVENRHVGMGGGMRVTITGYGFSKNQFNFADDAHVGNQVYFTNDYEQKECEVHKDGSTENRIECFAAADMAEGWWKVRVVVDGVETPDEAYCGGDKNSWNCLLNVNKGYTPLIRWIYPRSGEPNTIITMYGRFFTDLYGSNVATATNGKTQQILRAFVGAQNCDLKDGDDLYGMYLDGGSSDWGYIKCKISSSSAANSNVSVLIQPPYGRTIAESPSLYQVSAEQKLYLFQSYAVIDSISPSSGSDNGGQLLTITGKYFQEEKSSVMIDGEECAVESWGDNVIMCRTPAKSANASSYPGNRGLSFSFFNTTFSYSSNLDTMLERTDSAMDWVIDEAAICEGTNRQDCDERLRINQDRINGVAKGYFVPPKDGSYRFKARGDDHAVVYFSAVGPEESKTKILAFMSATGSNFEKYVNQTSPLFDLEGGKRYYMEVAYAEFSSYSNFEVSVMFYDTNLVHKQDGVVMPEKQYIDLKGEENTENLRITLSGLTTQTGTSEVQTVTMTSTNTDGTWQLGMYGAYTDILDVDTSDIDLQNALNDLPTIYPERVSVAATDVTNGRQYVITFDTNMGDYPKLTRKQSSVSVVIAETADGVASFHKWKLKLDHSGSTLLSDQLSTRSPSQEQMRETISSLFRAQCPQTIMNPRSGKYFHESFESTSSTGFFYGNHELVEEPFCGKGSSKNPGRIYSNINGWSQVSLDFYPKMCMGYRGGLQNKMYVYWMSNQRGWRWDEISVETNQDGAWHYLCLDIVEGIKLAWNGAFVGDSGFQMRYFDIKREGDIQDFWVDEVYIGGKDTTAYPEELDSRRIPPVIIEKSLDVTFNSTENYFDVVFTPQNCENTFAIIQVMNAPRQSGSTSTSSTNVVFGGGTFPSGATVQIERSLKASSPMTGTWDLTYNGTTHQGMDADIDETDLETYIQLELGINDAKVTKVESCYGSTYEVEFVRSAGNQLALEPDGSNLVQAAASTTPTIKFWEDDGHVMYSPIPGDLLRTKETERQVQLTINGIAARCNGDCSYTYEEVSSTVTDVSPTEGTVGDALTITGTGFSTTAADMYVMVGDSPCEVSTSSATEITCTLGGGTAGNSSVKVAVNDQGFGSGDVLFTVNPGVATVSPSTPGGTGGGVTLTIAGTGFDVTPAVTIGGSDCDVKSVAIDMITCVTPPGSGGEAELVVTVAGSPLTVPSNYTYQANISPTVSSISPATASVMGTETVEISGQDFGEVESVTVSLKSASGVITEVPLNKTGCSDTYLTGTMPSVAPGAYMLNVEVDGVGYADFGGVSQTIQVTLSVSSFTPSKGSLEGGTLVAITGEGFGTNDDAVRVMIGEAECDVDTVNDTEIVCKTEPGSITHIVNNGGRSSKYGLGYAWNPLELEIFAGDRVRFQWTSPPFVEANFYKVAQTSSADTDHDGTGFNSGEGSNNGYFVHQFLVPGTYFYSSGPVDIQQIVEMRGKIIVAERRGYTAELKVFVNGQEATFNASGNTTLPVSSCDYGDFEMSGCSEDSALSETNNEFSFAECRTPDFTEQSVTEGYINTDLVISGDGFSTTACQNEVMVGEFSCISTAQTAQEITCNLDASEEPDVGIVYPVTVRVNNIGRALKLFENNTFVLLPSITAMSPNSGSLHGGTQVTITGAGFVGSTTVQVGAVGSACRISSQTYTEIVCETDSSSEMSDDMQIIVTNQLGGAVPVACDANADCSFAYETSSTPTITGIHSPGWVSGASTDVIINGTSFGTTAAGVNVMFSSGEECNITSAADDVIECTVGPVKAGNPTVTINIAGKGNSISVNLPAQGELASISPAEGSIHGALEVTLTGNGFHEDDVSVMIGGVDCVVTSASITEIVCTTGANAAGSYDAVVVSGFVTFPIVTFDYSTDATPDPTAITASNGEATITGTGFSTTAGDNTVTIGGAACAVTAATATEITCTLGRNTAGEHALYMEVDGKGGSDQDLMYTYQLTASAASPDSGSFGGEQSVVITGAGFFSPSVTICDHECVVIESTPDNVTCSSPSLESDFGNGNKACDVVVTDGAQNMTIANGFTYQESTTPQITNVSPRRGGTMGGTRITVTGTKFGSAGNNVVKVDGAVCDIVSDSQTEIVCDTNAPGRSSKTQVVVEVGELGTSLLADADYWYVDVWSSNFTWGGAAPPTEGDFVVIPQGQLLLLDQSTPKLKMLLIQGGELLFDEVDLTLRSENILIVSGGRLTVGTEDAPFQHDATIEMHGMLRSPELPIYGAKCLAVREGELNLHGKPIRMTWTRLSDTASPGDTEIKLEYGMLDWPVGSTIVIATTGHRHSQGETETKVITAVSIDGKTLTLDSALDFPHLGETVDLGGGHSLEMRAEVAILSRNVRVIGSRDTQWADDIEACPEGFDTGEFATQTCFQGRFGDEIGSDQFGAQIMFHAPIKDSQLARGKLSYFEVNYAGQAFKLGRYPVHFHLNGDMSGSYVRGAGIHETFNRAVNIHGTHNVLVEHVVVYNVMGGALFLEDGIETGNVYMYNLVLLSKASSSLLNDDVTPAAFWATNPNNTYIGNAAAGGTHFGWWYRMHEHPEGPSFTEDYCPRNVPLARVYNNTVHSNGWFGLWTFQDYHPMVGGGCDSTEPEPAVFDMFIVWNCEKGLEYVNGGALQFPNSLLVNNEKAGIEGKRHMKLGSDVAYTERGPLIRDSVIVADVGSISPFQHGDSIPRYGMILAWDYGWGTHNVTFINFNDEAENIMRMTSIDGTCSVFCGGYNYDFSGIKFINGDQRRGEFRWQADGVFRDLDGSLTGTANGAGTPGSKVVPWMDTLDPAKCTLDERFGFRHNAAVCSADMNFARFAFNNPQPTSMLYKDALFENEFGANAAVFSDKRMTHRDGWVTIVEIGQTYRMYWRDQEHITNISYSGGFYGLDGGIVLAHNSSRKPDKIRVAAGQDQDIEATQPAPLNPDTGVHGDFYYDENNQEISYLISTVDSRAKRDADGKYVIKNVQLSSYKCFWPDCTPPPDPNSLPPIEERPPGWVYWSNNTIWPNNALPQDGDDVVIPSGMWVVADVEFPALQSLVLRGNLEFDGDKIPGTDTYRTFSLEVTHLIIMGGRLVVGWEENRFRGEAEIILTGDQYSDDWPQTAGVSIGKKVIATYGGLDLHGIARIPVMCHLADTAAAGSNTITVNMDVDWVAGEIITIASTAKDPKQTEVRIIESVNGRTLTLTQALTYRHLGVTLQTETYGDISQQAEVALMTRNIKIKGSEHNDMVRLGFGGRVMMSQMLDPVDNVNYRGWARISYTQFENMGQLGYSEAYDPRFAVAYVQSGEVSNVKPSYLKGNAFYNNFSPVIGTFGATGIRISDNSAYRTVDGGMVITGDDHILERNIVLFNVWSGGYNGRSEAKNFRYDACYQLQDSGTITFKNNIAAGCERYGFRVHGEPCSTAAEQTEAWSGNRAHSSLFGVVVETTDPIYPECVKVEGFTAWKNHDFGFWVQVAKLNVEYKNNVVMDNGLGIFTLSFGFASLQHIRHNTITTVTGGLVMGATPSFDCVADAYEFDENIKKSALARSDRSITNGFLGITLTAYETNPNGSPTLPYVGRSSYPQISGQSIWQDVTFAHFQPRQCDGATVLDAAMSGLEAGDDMQHPAYVSGIQMESTVERNNIFNLYRSRVDTVNPSDCVDMDCDGHKKVLIHDLDGSVLGGSPGTVVDDATYQWDGDSRYGLGDYRIPKVALTLPNGTRIDPPNGKGIAMPDSCVYVDGWHGFECHEGKFEHLVIESMDRDNEVRRLSPISLISDNGYVDLLNGPQDHGWCAGYTCQKRVSTFWPVVMVGHEYEIHMTSTNPQHTRLYLLHAADTDSVRIAVYYHSPMRLDVFADQTFIFPANADRNLDDGNYNLLTPETRTQYIPSYDAVHGANYFDRTFQLQYINLKGSAPVDIIIKQVVVVSLSLPPMTIDDFFGPNIVNNLAAFLQVPANKIRVVNIVRETPNKKRSTDGVSIDIEIGDAPTENANISEVNAGDLDRSSLVNITRQLVDSIQLGTLGSTLNLTILGFNVQEPLPEPENATDSDWASVSSSESPFASIQIPTDLMHEVEPVSEREMQPFPTQPRFAMYDAAAEPVLILGSRADPWKITATLVNGSNADAYLTGATSCGFKDGNCTFETLGISHAGSDYEIRFDITDPASHSFPSFTTSGLSVAEADLTAGFPDVPMMSVLENTQFSVSVDIRDLSSGFVIPDLGWQGSAWTASLSIYKPEMAPNGSLAGTLSADFDLTTGLAVFNDLSIDRRGKYSLTATVDSTPAGVSFSGRSGVITIGSANVVMQDREYSYAMEMKFDEDYNTHAVGNEDLVEAAFYNYLISIDDSAHYHDFNVSQGSIYVNFWISGSPTPTQAVIDQLASDLTNGLAVQMPNGQLTAGKHLKVDGVFQDGLGETTQTTQSTEVPGAAPGPDSQMIMIIGIVLGCLILISLIVIVVVVVAKKKRASKTHPDSEQASATNMKETDTTTKSGQNDGQFSPQVERAATKL